MENNLRYFRETTNISVIELAKLLNISVHTYRAIENNKITVPGELIIMIGKIYKIATYQIFENNIQRDYSLAKQLYQWSMLEKGERFALAFFNLTGEAISCQPYKQIRKVKNEIAQMINESSII